jgi:cytochrome P450
VTSIVEKFAREKSVEDGKGYPREREAMSSATLGDALLGLGSGRHTCPGRFFFLNKMKVLIAHVLSNFELEYVRVRSQPLNTVWLEPPLHSDKIQ